MREQILWGSTPRPSSYRSSDGQRCSPRDRTSRGGDGAVAVSGGAYHQSMQFPPPTDSRPPTEVSSMDEESFAAMSGEATSSSATRYARRILTEDDHSFAYSETSSVDTAGGTHYRGSQTARANFFMGCDPSSPEYQRPVSLPTYIPTGNPGVYVAA